MENKNKKILIYTGGAIVLLLAFAISGAYAFEQKYQARFYPGVHVGYIALGGKTKAQALTEFKNLEHNFQESGLKFQFDKKTVTLYPITQAVNDPDLARTIVSFDWNQTVEKAFRVGRGANPFRWLTGKFGATNVAPIFEFNQTEAKALLQENFSEFETPAKNAELTIDGDVPSITEESSGKIFKYDKTLATVATNIAKLDFTPVPMMLVVQEPTIKKQQAASALSSLEHILAIDELTIIYKDETWPIPKTTFRDWLTFQLQGDEMVVGFDKEKVLVFLEPIAKVVNVSSQDAKFKLEDGRVTEFQASQDGQVLDLEATYAKINLAALTGNTAPIELVVAVSPAQVATGELNDLGIVELVGRGMTNFKGSPVNRRHNIGVGAAAVNGRLIKPGEEFSLLEALGTIDGTTGYRQELVIKGDRTIPEYGGGLCQIGTTAFRVALDAGMPITARRNHSYRVSYYEPPVGMDATIYDPAPDFKFLNDTGHHLLFVTRIEGDDAIFELYGTKDGRNVEISEPVVYNITSPGEPRYIETTDLKPGEKKKVESAHAGAEANFDYKVTYPSGEVKEVNFHSKYVPWKETWLVGIDPNAATSTDPLLEGAPVVAEPVSPSTN